MTIYEFAFPPTISGAPFEVESIKGKVVLIVNTASNCGYTNQFSGLESIYSKYKDQGLVVLGFPCNQFHQELGTNSEITEFCQRNYGVSFPMMSKIDVNGVNAHPLYEYLKKEKKGILGLKRIKWNFEKFLVDRTGQVVQRFSSMTVPESIESKIIELL